VKQASNTVKKGFHCAYQIHYHIVFPVKYRRALLYEDVEKIIVETVVGIEERYDIEMEAVGCDKNHIHLLCGAHPKIAPGDIVRIFKSITTREIKKKKPAIEEEMWGGEFWSDGYYVATVGERGNWGKVEKYVKNQGQGTEVKQLKLF
jgi:putative transposase